jgi:ribosome-binding protein aMBF1 (putative translation factor)
MTIMAQTRNFAEVLKRKLSANRALARRVEEHDLQSGVAEQIYNARTEAGLTQAELANRMGTHQSVIARLEDADYQGHTLSMLRRIGEVLGKRLRVEFETNSCVASRKGSVATTAAGKSSTAAKARKLPRNRKP